MDASPPRSSALNSAPRSSALNAAAAGSGSSSSNPSAPHRASLVAPPEFMQQKNKGTAAVLQPINPFAKESRPHKEPPAANPFAKFTPTQLKGDKK